MAGSNDRNGRKAERPLLRSSAIRRGAIWPKTACPRQGKDKGKAVACAELAERQKVALLTCGKPSPSSTGLKRRRDRQGARNQAAHAVGAAAGGRLPPTVYRPVDSAPGCKARHWTFAWSAAVSRSDPWKAELRDQEAARKAAERQASRPVEHTCVSW
jgi:hypothetical protein